MLAEPTCYTRNCAHFIGVSQPDGTEQSERVVCAAFPIEIPSVIAYGKNKHHRKFPGQQNDLVYKRKLRVAKTA